MPTNDPRHVGLAAGGGSDRSDFASLDLEGNKTDYGDDYDHDELAKYRSIGAHNGHMSGLNVLGAEPGFHHFWIVDSESAHRVARNRGGEPVEASGETRAAASAQVGARHSDDNLVRFNELVLYRMPIAKYREYQERLAVQSEARLHGTEADLMSGVSAAERTMSPRGPSRFRRRDHRIEVRGGITDDAQIHSQWTPDKGIIEEG